LCQGEDKKQEEILPTKKEDILKIVCLTCGHSFAIITPKRVAKCSCPKCNTKLFAYYNGKVEKLPTKKVEPQPQLQPQKDIVKESPQPVRKPISIYQKRAEEKLEQRLRDQSLILMICALLLSGILLFVLSDTFFKDIGTIMKKGLQRMVALLTPRPSQTPAVSQPSASKKPQAPKVTGKPFSEEEEKKEKKTTPKPEESVVDDEMQKMLKQIEDDIKIWNREHKRFKLKPPENLAEYRRTMMHLHARKMEIKQDIKKFEKRFNTNYKGIWFADEKQE
jgi:predicted  nucleic acid-binding Zn-ribbon protein